MSMDVKVYEHKSWDKQGRKKIQAKAAHTRMAFLIRVWQSKSRQAIRIPSKSKAKSRSDHTRMGKSYAYGPGLYASHTRFVQILCKSSLCPYAYRESHTRMRPKMLLISDLYKPVLRISRGGGFLDEKDTWRALENSEFEEGFTSFKSLHN